MSSNRSVWLARNHCLIKIGIEKITLKKPTISGVARVISLGGGTKTEGSEKKWGSGSEKNFWGKTGSEKNFVGTTPFRTSESASFWKNILNLGFSQTPTFLSLGGGGDRPPFPLATPLPMVQK